ncbi:zmpB [Symbiodinium sp. CCMP2592]|nr:zmpB [Symbiodinium sp. CCMP2592]
MHEFVCCGNVLSSRIALVIHLCHYLKLRWILEQPDGSFLPQMPCYQQLWRTFQVWEGSFWMGLFNGPSPKRHRVWSNCKGIIDAITEKAGSMSREQMSRLPCRLANHYEDKNGVKRHTGKSKELQKSQQYTREFGDFLAKYFVEIMKEPFEPLTASTAPNIDPSMTDHELFVKHYVTKTGYLLGDIWDAELPSILYYLNAKHVEAPGSDTEDYGALDRHAFAAGSSLELQNAAADPAEQAAYDAVMEKLGLAASSADAAPAAKRSKVEPGSSSQGPQEQQQKRKPGPKPKDKGEQLKRKADDDLGSDVASAKKGKASAAHVETKSTPASHRDEPSPPPAQPEKPPKAKKGNAARAAVPEESTQTTTAAPKQSQPPPEDTAAPPKESPKDTEESKAPKGKAKAKGRPKAKAASTDTKPPASRVRAKKPQAAEQEKEPDTQEFWDNDLGMMVSWARFDEVLKKVLELHDETPASIAAALEDVLGPCPQEIAGNIPDYAPGSSRHPGPVLEAPSPKNLQNSFEEQSTPEAFKLKRSCKTLIAGIKMTNRMADAGRAATPVKHQDENLAELFDGLLCCTNWFGSHPD